ncbi:MAG: DUF4197 domain-containing protein [Alphaproteobacteria bacterium]|uniref:DUF4197 domain-containing protein n=1 Tax=Candidatus Nitrobium versatile TaxID=2884831 RepID=A0A953J9N6_9BACT|nr:DUF4197 domain-containing protein [Candidatus Nitrobium versatile]
MPFLGSVLFFLFLLLFIPAASSYAGLLDGVLRAIGVAPAPHQDAPYRDVPQEEDTIASGLKEALSVGVEKAVASVSKEDGYFGNEAIKIPLPEKLRTVASAMGRFGLQEEVDDVVLGMNRAAENAAPHAKAIFMEGIKRMTLDDARKILQGGNTAATDFFRKKMSEDLYKAFKPVVTSSMEEVGLVRSYKNMMKRYMSLPFVRQQSLDLDHYVTQQALEGLFFMIGEEEKKIRTDPAARVTDLLKKLFGN